MPPFLPRPLPPFATACRTWIPSSNGDSSLWALHKTSGMKASSSSIAFTHQGTSGICALPAAVQRSQLQQLGGGELAPGRFGLGQVGLKEVDVEIGDGLPAVRGGALDVEVGEANRCIVQQLRIARPDCVSQELPQPPLGANLVLGDLVL
jgi:hypothetical protein